MNRIIKIRFAFLSTWRSSWCEMFKWVQVATRSSTAVMTGSCSRLHSTTQRSAAQRNVQWAALLWRHHSERDS